MERQLPAKATRSTTESVTGTVALGLPLVLVALRPTFHQLWVMLVALIIGLVALVVYFVERRRTRALLRESGYRMCLRCRHLLTGLPDSGNCPECGSKYDLDRQRAVWSDAYRVP